MKKLAKYQKLFLKNKSLSENSLRSYQTAYRHYTDFISGKQESPENVMKFFKSIENTFRPRYYNLIRTIVQQHLTEKYKIDIDALVQIREVFLRIKKAKPVNNILADKYFTEKDILFIASKLSDRLSCIWQFAWQTGLRVSEIIQVQKNDIIIQKNTAYIYVRKAKGGKEYKTFCSVPLLEKIISIYSHSQKYLFETRTNKQLDRKNIDKELKRQGRKIGYNLSLHKCRHSKAVYLRDVKKLDARQISMSLNHSNVQTTLNFYFHDTLTPDMQGIEEMEIV